MTNSCILVPIKYQGKEYPHPIKATIQEVPAHFDCMLNRKYLNEAQVKASVGADNYSLHTEYSAGDRKAFNGNCSILNIYPELKRSHYKGIPLLWTSEQWANEFANYIFEITKNRIPPKIIEIHPPFKDYCPNFELFISRYKIFEEIIKHKYPNTEILIENRTGSQYQGAKFLFTKIKDLDALTKIIEKENLKLRIALDLPQLLSGNQEKIMIKVKGKNEEVWGKSKEKLNLLFECIRRNRTYIKAIHVWSRDKKLPKKEQHHKGTFDTWFDPERPNDKKQILENFNIALADGIPRYIVPEVNSTQEDFNSILKDLTLNGFKFV